MKKLILSIDLDEFYHIRWVIGSEKSLFTDNKEFFAKIYHSDSPRGDIIEQTKKLLDLFDRSNTKITFFILGEVAAYYPSLVKEIAAKGHEISCHSYRHIDLDYHTVDSFRNELKDAKHLLEDLTGNKVIGFRMPNLIIKDWVKEILLELAFEYDSSICPSRSVTNKFGDFVDYPVYPYRTKENNFKPGDTKFWEFPLAVFPIIKLPGATGSVTRAFGKLWSYTTFWNVRIKGGIPGYYFHPWETGHVPEGINIDSFYRKLFTRRTGKWMFDFAEILLRKYICINYSQFLKSEVTL